MNNKPLLSIAILTWNRAPYLENLLNNILPQAKELKEKVEICISNNGSTDNTREVVMEFKEKYPGLIKYNENKENLGFDRNLLKVMEMSIGSFIWTFGDDDDIVENGLKEVVEFIKKIPKENVGLITLKGEAYFIDKQTRKKIIYYNSLDKKHSEIYKIDKKDIFFRFVEYMSISTLLFNNKTVKKIFREDKDIIEKEIGDVSIHALIYSLMFLKYPHIKGITFNKKIVYSELAYHKPFIEDRLRANYEMPKKLYHVMISNKYMDDYYVPLFVKKDKELRRAFVIDMMVLRAFDSFNYVSYSDCLRLFFQYAVFIDALLFSLVFSILFLIPGKVLRFMYKVLLMIRCGKKWRKQWQFITSYNSQQLGGARRSADTDDIAN